MIQDIPVPEAQWHPFCENFSRQHHGWLIGMHQLDTRQLEQGETAAQAGVPLISDNRPLQEVREERKDDIIEVMVTVGEGTDETSFLIEDVVALYRRRIGDAHEGLRIDNRNGTTTLIEFRIATEPEALDGFAD